MLAVSFKDQHISLNCHRFSCSHFDINLFTVIFLFSFSIHELFYFSCPLLFTFTSFHPLYIFLFPYSFVCRKYSSVCFYFVLVILSSCLPVFFFSLRLAVFAPFPCLLRFIAFHASHFPLLRHLALSTRARLRD